MDDIAYFASVITVYLIVCGLAAFVPGIMNYGLWRMGCGFYEGRQISPMAENAFGIFLPMFLSTGLLVLCGIFQAYMTFTTLDPALIPGENLRPLVARLVGLSASGGWLIGAVLGWYHTPRFKPMHLDTDQDPR